MSEGNGGILLDIFPPVSWDEEDIVLALEITDNSEENPEEGWGFTPEEMKFLARCIRYYKEQVSEEDWGNNFIIGSEVDHEDPDEDGRIIIDMTYPPHLEAPASLR